MIELLTDKQIKFYENLGIYSKRRRLIRKKAQKIINEDGYKRFGYVKRNGVWGKESNRGCGVEYGGIN